MVRAASSSHPIRQERAMAEQVSLQRGLVEQVRKLIDGGQAHVGFDRAVAGMPVELRGVRPERVPYSAWQLVEHLRIAQRDILEFSTDDQGRGYKAREWPKAYWPESADPPSAEAWDGALAAIREDREAFEELLMQESADLLAAFPWGEGQNLLREALLIADHNAYHVGELVLLRRLLGAWS